MNTWIRQFIQVIAGVGMLVGTYSCEFCKAYELPMLTLQIQEDQMHTYTVSGELLEPTLLRSNERLQLPFSLKSDTAVYDVEREDGVVKRLVLGYERSSAFENEGCGFYLKVQKLSTLPETTFTELALVNNEYGAGWEIIIYE